MSARTTSKSALFLMELIIAILFFSVASAVCIKLFVHSHLISEKTIQINHSVLISQNIAESFINAKGDHAQLVKLLDASIQPPNQLMLYYDKNWLHTDAEHASFIVTTELYSENLIQFADITIVDQNSNVLYQNLASYYPQNTVEAIH